MSKSPAVIFRLVSQWVFLGTIFLTPVIVLPWTVDAFETNKQAILVIGISLSAACSMISLALERRALAKPSGLLFLPILFFVANVLSASASLAPMTSWIGQGAQEYVSVLSLVSFLTLFVLTQAFVRDLRFASHLILTLFASSALTSLILLPVFLGVGTGTFTNVIGTPHAYAIYLLAMSLLAGGLWLTDKRFEKKWIQRFFLITTVVTFFGYLFTALALDSVLIWSLTLVGTVVIFLAVFVHAEKFHDPLRFAPIMSLFVLALIFIALPTHFPSPFLQEVSPNLQTTINTVTGAWNEGSVIWGTGPGTFSLVYTKYAALAVNQTDFWDVVFDRGNAYITTQLTTLGVFGVLSLLFFIIPFCVLGVKRIYASEDDWNQILPLFVSWFLLVVAMFFYAENMALLTLFWLFSGSLAGSFVSLHAVNEKRHARAFMTTLFITVLALVSAVTTLFLTVPRYIAEITFARAVHQNAAADTASQVDTVIHLLDRAAATNPWNDSYYRNLSAALLRRLTLLSSEEAADSEYVQSVIASAISAGMKATDISPANVLNWDVRGMIYRELLAVVPDAAQPSVAAYERAIELAPINPRYRVEAARAYLSIADAQNPLLQNDDEDVADQAQSAKDDALQRAEEHLTTAVALKEDYAPARYYLALLKERQGDLADAVRDLEKVKLQAPNDVGVGFELGVLYLRQGKNEQAQIELQHVISLAPSYADAHWYLSVSYEQQGDARAAIDEVEKVLETNPDNEAAKSRLARLQQGLPPETEIPEPVDGTSTILP